MADASRRSPAQSPGSAVGRPSCQRAAARRERRRPMEAQDRGGTQVRVGRPDRAWATCPGRPARLASRAKAAEHPRGVGQDRAGPAAREDRGLGGVGSRANGGRSLELGRRRRRVGPNSRQPSVFGAGRPNAARATSVQGAHARDQRSSRTRPRPTGSAQGPRGRPHGGPGRESARAVPAGVEAPARSWSPRPAAWRGRHRGAVGVPAVAVPAAPWRHATEASALDRVDINY